jgi:hypothetical protein
MVKRTSSTEIIGFNRAVVDTGEVPSQEAILEQATKAAPVNNWRGEAGQVERGDAHPVGSAELLGSFHDPIAKLTA